MAEKQTSTEKLATRSDYERGKMDGLAEATELIRERANQLQRELMIEHKTSDFHRLPGIARDQLSTYRKAADFLWGIYKRRVI